MTQHDAVFSTVTQAVTEHSMTHADPGQNATNRVSQVCQLESVLTKHSAQQNGHIMTLQLPHQHRMRVWLPASDKVSLPAMESVLYVETELLQRPLKGNTKSSAPLHSLRLLRYWQPIESDYSLSYLQTLFDKTPKPHALLRLLALIARLQDKRLQKLLTTLFSRIDIAAPFISLPASFNHHHSMPGGLLLHSVECAEWLESIAFSTLSKREAQLTLVAALLHDLGKIETMSQSDAPVSD
ncbi:TraI domain-containing protein [methane-oxidizing endosymbiont of Gigantopelta aegis]|uniref:TraI domain-containing protein n=1 Tax=methane-oxidizing endosymbiont of Gigantopelta aegis TaxID=2794938 RepID=UPI0018DCAA65|nr:TraI domain-containing protein [methane-oxidizing endosymbiont of Gigantopelta aegis]